MNVAVVSTVPIYPTTGGNRARIANFVRTLQTFGHTVEFIYLPSRRVNDADLESHVRYFSEQNFHVLRRSAYHDLVYYSRRAVYKSKRRLRRWRDPSDGYYYELDEIYFPGFTAQLKRLAGERRYDAVFVQYVYNSKALDVFGSETLKILDTHDSYADRHRDYLERGSAYHGYSITVEDQMRGFRRADIVLAIQEDEASRFKDGLGQHAYKVRTVSHILDLSRKICHRDLCAATFLGSSFQENVEAITFFIRECLPLVASVKPEFRLIVAGSVCDRVSDSPNVVKLGIIPHIADAFAQGPIALNPARLGSGINIKLLDAMSCGVPSVSTATGARGVPNELRGGVFVVPDDAAAGFAGAVLELLDNRKRNQQAGEAAYAAAQRWNAIQLAALHGVLSANAARPEPAGIGKLCR